MLDVATFESLAQGDLVEVGPLLPGLAPEEPVVLSVVTVDKGRLHFDMLWFDTIIGRCTCKKNEKGELEWMTA